MVQIPKLPDKEELAFREKEFLLTVYEQFQRSSKKLFYVLLAVLILAWPVSRGLEAGLAGFFISRYQPPFVNTAPYVASDLRAIKTEVLPVASGIVSVYGQVLNPNPEISASGFTYRFTLKDSRNTVLNEVFGESHLLAGESKFLLAPTVAVSRVPSQVELAFENVRWTRRSPSFPIRLEVIQKNTGLTTERNFFVEGTVRNLESLQIKKVNVDVLVFDQTGREILAVNGTVFTDLIPHEDRYFRVIWPNDESFPPEQVQILPSVNLLEPGAVLEDVPRIPPR